jgi:PAS domain S-box-containing protein
MTRILIVEDDRVVAWNLQETLQLLGYQVIATTTSGTEAIEIARATSLDLVLMDIRLRGNMDGIVTAQLIQTELKIPVVYLTAHADEQTLARAISVSPFGYLLKPFSRMELQAAIQTALKRYATEQQLDASRQWLVTTLNSIGDPMIATDESGRITFINPVAADLTGWSQAEALGQPINQVLDLFHAKTRESIENPLLQAIRQGKPVTCPKDSTLRTKTGVERAIGDSATPVKNSRGEIIGGVLVFQDITERRQAELAQQIFTAELERQVKERTAQLQQALDFEATLKRITDRVRDSLDEDQILEAAVHELATTLGVNGCNAAIYDLEQNLSTVRYEFTSYSTPFRGNIIQMANFQQGYEQLLRGQYFQFCGLFPYPERGRAATLACPIQDDQGVLGDLWVVHEPEHGFSDMEIRLVQQVANQCAIALRQSRLYQAAQAQVEELARLNQLKDDFINTLSHELRTPMSNIKLATQMLEIILQRLGILQQVDSVSRYFQILGQETDREIELINDLLDLSLLGNESEPQLLTALHLQAWIPHIVESFVERTCSSQHPIDMDIPVQLPPLTTDALYLERILFQLLDNACKFTPEGERILISASLVQTRSGEKAEGGEQRAEADNSPSLRPPYFQIDVTNFGVEIPNQERDRIFDRFYRIPNSDPWKHKGLGVGLALVKKLTERLGAIVQVRSGNNQTTFLLQFPLPDP